MEFPSIPTAFPSQARNPLNSAMNLVRARNGNRPVSDDSRLLGWQRPGIRGRSNEMNPNILGQMNPVASANRPASTWNLGTAGAQTQFLDRPKLPATPWSGRPFGPDAGVLRGPLELQRNPVQSQPADMARTMDDAKRLAAMRLLQAQRTGF